MSCCSRPLRSPSASLGALALYALRPLRSSSASLREPHTPKPKPDSPRILEKTVIFADL